MVEQVKTKSEPRVRFRGFDDEWELRKLGDAATFSKGKGLSKDSFSDEGVPCLHYGELFTTYGDNINNIDTRTDIDGSSMVYSEGYEVLVPSSSTVADKAVTASAINIPDVMLGGDINIIKPDSTLNNSFLSLLINYGYRNKVWSLVQTGTITHLYNKDLKHLKFRRPSLDEQQKIGELFQTLDKAIDLSNTQVANLKQQKKALLQRLFPQKGETEPKVRLRGFTDEWDSSLLLDEIEVYQPKSLPQSKFLDEGYPVYGANGMIGYYDEYNHENRQIAMACRGNTAGVVNIIPEQSYITGNAMIMDVYTNDELDFNFMGQLFNNFDFTPYISGSGQPQITRSALKGAYIQLPSLEEQQAIGELFQTVDEQISLAEDKVSQYKELKQALLQRLFV